MSTDLSPAEELAFPFIQAACRLSEMKESGADRGELLEAVGRNAALWMYFEKQIVPTALELNEEARQLMGRMSKFMVNSSIVLEREFSLDLVDRIIDINLQLSEEILSAPITLH